MKEDTVVCRASRTTGVIATIVSWKSDMALAVCEECSSAIGEAVWKPVPLQPVTLHTADGEVTVGPSAVRPTCPACGGPMEIVGEVRK